MPALFCHPGLLGSFIIPAVAFFFGRSGILESAVHDPGSLSDGIAFRTVRIRQAQQHHRYPADSFCFTVLSGGSDLLQDLRFPVLFLDGRNRYRCDHQFLVEHEIHAERKSLCDPVTGSTGHLSDLPLLCEEARQRTLFPALASADAGKRFSAVVSDRLGASLDRETGSYGVWRLSQPLYRYRYRFGETGHPAEFHRRDEVFLLRL